MQSLTPKTLAELAQALSAATEKAKIIAGGTDFIIKERAGKFAPDLLIYPGFIPELNTVTKENGVLRIGAAVPMNGITAALKDDKAFCAIADAASDVGSPQIRNRGTLGGNIANASPAADTLGPLALHRARLLLRGPQGARECSLGELVTAPYRNALLPGELIEAVRIDKLDCPQRFFKLGRRRALAISRLTVSVSGRLTDGRIDDLRVALGSAFPRPMCFPEITEAVQGERPTPELLRRIAAQTAAKLPEIAGVRASTLYKQPVSQKLLERLLGELFEVQYG